jgi:hypothetical protein
MAGELFRRWSVAPCTDFKIKLQRLVPLPTLRPLSSLPMVLRRMVGKGVHCCAIPQCRGSAFAHPTADGRHGHFTTGGSEERIESTLPPVLSPKMVPRS